MNSMEKQHDDGRRSFLKLAVGTASMLVITPSLARAQTDTRRRSLYQLEDKYSGFDKSVGLRISRVSRPAAPARMRDNFQGYFLNKGVLVPEAYKELCYVFRDWRLGETDGVVQIDINLLNLLAAMQLHLDSVTGKETSFLLTSGYRSPETNSRIEGAAKNSFHMRGMAADIVCPGVPVDYLNKLALYFQTGGVGIYLKSKFVHVDSGRVRRWSGR